MRGEHRWELQRALPQEIGVSGALRDAGLRSIGREDLVIDSPRDEKGNRVLWKHVSDKPYVNVAVHVTKEQRDALRAAAKELGVSMSSLLLDALRSELRLKTVKPAEHPGGWTRGKRRSGTPPA
jgi:hypothetical protein